MPGWIDAIVVESARPRVLRALSRRRCGHAGFRLFLVGVMREAIDQAELLDWNFHFGIPKRQQLTPYVTFSP
jgi:hypothetical protein